jgi:hypothetical protein
MTPNAKAARDGRPSGKLTGARAVPRGEGAGLRVLCWRPFGLR